MAAEADFGALALGESKPDCGGLRQCAPKSCSESKWSEDDSQLPQPSWISAIEDGKSGIERLKALVAAGGLDFHTLVSWEANKRKLANPSFTPLGFAIHKSNYEAVKILLEALTLTLDKADATNVLDEICYDVGRNRAGNRIQQTPLGAAIVSSLERSAGGDSQFDIVQLILKARVANQLDIDSVCQIGGAKPGTPRRHLNGLQCTPVDLVILYGEPKLKDLIASYSSLL